MKRKKKSSLYYLVLKTSVEYKKCNLRCDATRNLETAVHDRLLLVLTKWYM